MKLALLLPLLFILPSCEEEKRRPRPETQVETKDPDKKEKKSLLNIPAGAVIGDLVLPYNDGEKKISLLTIKKLIVADEPGETQTILNGEDLRLWLFDDEGTIQSKTTMRAADYYMEQEQLVAKSEILMVGSGGKFAAKSKGAKFSLATGQAILIGPAISKFTIPPKKKNQTP